MDFRRSGQLDERRRRVLRDELAQPAETESADSAPAPGGGSAKGPVRAYSPAVLDERQLRVTDLVPVRPLWAAVAILLALTAVAAIECVHIHARTIDLGSAQHVVALDAAHRGSVAGWLAAILFAGGALLALVTFGIRLHRVDDYRGRYRVWLWTAAALAWASLDAATGLHDSVGLLLARLAGRSPESASLAAACTISWLAMYGLLFGTLAIRLAIEVWCSLPSVAALTVAALLYLIAGLGVLDILPQHGPLVDSVVRTMIALLAHVALVSAVALYARHVYLDATGRLKVHIDPDKKRQAKKPRTKLKVVKRDELEERADEKPAARPAAVAADKSSSNNAPLKFGVSSVGSSQPKAGAAISKSAASSADYDDEDEDEDDGSSEGQRLSRAERRKLKKMARRDGQRRAA